MKTLSDLARKQLATILLLLFLIGIGALIILLAPAKAAPSSQEYYQTIPQCQGLTKAQCIALLEQQVTTAKLKRNLMWEQR